MRNSGSTYFANVAKIAKFVEEYSGHVLTTVPSNASCADVSLVRFHGEGILYIERFAGHESKISGILLDTYISTVVPLRLTATEKRHIENIIDTYKPLVQKYDATERESF